MSDLKYLKFTKMFSPKICWYRLIYFTSIWLASNTPNFTWRHGIFWIKGSVQKYIFIVNYITIRLLSKCSTLLSLPCPHYPTWGVVFSCLFVIYLRGIWLISHVNLSHMSQTHTGQDGSDYFPRFSVESRRITFLRVKGSICQTHGQILFWEDWIKYAPFSEKSL